MRTVSGLTHQQRRNRGSHGRVVENLVASGQVLAWQEGGRHQLSRFPTGVKEQTKASLALNQVAVVDILVVPGTPGAPVAVEVAGRVDLSPVVSLGSGFGESESVEIAGKVCGSSGSPSDESVNGVPVYNGMGKWLRDCFPRNINSRKRQWRQRGQS